MSRKTYPQLREEAKEYYMNIGEVKCPALKGATVTFKSCGFKHLIYKNKRFRPIADQIRRFKALKHVKEILENSSIHSEYRIGENAVQFWSFSKIISDKCITVVLRKKRDSKIHFLSIRSDRNTKPPEGGL